MSELRALALQLWLDRLTKRSRLSAADERTVMDLPAVLQRVPANRDIVRLGENVTHACLIARGTAARFGQTREGQRQLSAIHIPGDMADLHSVVLPHATSALQALSPVEAMRIPHEALKQAADGSPSLGRAFWRDCVADAQIAAEWLVTNCRRDARARIAHLLCELAVRFAAFGHQRDSFPFGMTQVHLADATGLTPVHVNRTLRDLRESGLVEVPAREVRILDWDALATVAEFDPAYLHFDCER